jgi:hypothetical protein
MLYLEALKNKLTTLRLFMTYGERIIKGSISEIVIPALDKRGGTVIKEDLFPNKYTQSFKA